MCLCLSVSHLNCFVCMSFRSTYSVFSCFLYSVALCSLLSFPTLLRSCPVPITPCSTVPLTLHYSVPLTLFHRSPHTVPPCPLLCSNVPLTLLYRSPYSPFHHSPYSLFDHSHCSVLPLFLLCSTVPLTIYSLVSFTLCFPFSPRSVYPRFPSLFPLFPYFLSPYPVPFFHFTLLSLFPYHLLLSLTLGFFLSLPLSSSFPLLSVTPFSLLSSISTLPLIFLFSSLSALPRVRLSLALHSPLRIALGSPWQGINN